MKIWIKRIFLVLGVLLLMGVLYAAFAPLPHNAELPKEKWGAGSSSVEPAYSGLERAFPPINETATSSPKTVELGRLLFFDPILSQNNDISCATCHNPDLGFTDGKGQAVGNHGVLLPRSSMSLWNVAYNTSFFWDGRATSLEEQMTTPLTGQNEMVASPDGIVSELQDIPEYVALFEGAFGEDAVTYENMQTAIAAFERTLITNNSPFDKYAAGDVDALTASQRRGLGLFRSAGTRCFECHSAPTFGDESFSVTGVPDLPGQVHDTGRLQVESTSLDGAFKAPTLRNIALTAPYMHNGTFATLEEVVEFYAKGGGRDEGVENMDIHVLGFDLTTQEKADLVAFMYALTDESNLPEFPESVPSGLSVVKHVESPAREFVSQMNASGTEAGTTSPHEPTTLRVEKGQTIQSVVDQALPGDTIEVPYGIYKEHVIIDISNVKFLGIPNAKGEWPVIEGEGTGSDGVIASGNDFEMGFFAVKNFTSNGVLVEGSKNIYLHDMYIENTGVYGVYPVRCTDVLIERIEGTLMNDAAIYAGKSENVVIRDTLTYGNVIGVELENTVNGEVYNNVAHDNTIGIFIDLLPQLPSKVSMYTKVHDNLTENNNGENFGKPGSAVSLIPPGTGMLILAADHVEVYNNTIRGNKTGGLAVFNLTIGFSAEEIDVDPNPDHNYAHDNIYENNGYDADKFVKDMLGDGFDIIWDGSGIDNRFDEPNAQTSFPPVLPSSKWPQPVYNLYWRLLNFVVGLVS